MYFFSLFPFRILSDTLQKTAIIFFNFTTFIEIFPCAMLDSQVTDKYCFSFYFFLKLKYRIFTILCFRCIAKRCSYSYMYAAAAAAAAKSLQSCPTLCHPRDGSPPGSAVPGILQARTLE